MKGIYKIAGVLLVLGMGVLCYLILDQLNAFEAEVVKINEFGDFIKPEQYAEPIETYFYILFALMVGMLGLIIAGKGQNSNDASGTEFNLNVEEHDDEEEEQTSVDHSALFESFDKELQSISVPQQKGERLLSLLSDQFEGVAATLYLKNGDGQYHLSNTYAIDVHEDHQSFGLGEGLIGQTAASHQIIAVEDIPVAHFDVASGLGNAKPSSLYVVPLQNGPQVTAVFEVATFRALTKEQNQQLEAIMNKGGNWFAAKTSEE